MSKEIQERIGKLRTEMKAKGFNACLINGSDPHMSEYVPARWQSREYISGFSGSYGWLAITMDKAVLWTDSRYYLQANQQLEGTGITMMKARDPESLTMDKWIVQELQSGDTVAFDGTCYSNAEVSSFKEAFTLKGIKINFQSDLLNDIWTDRPALPNHKAFLHPVKWAGLSRKEKFALINDELTKVGAEIMIITALDDLAWTFNLRGADVECNPVALGFGIIGNNEIKLFIDPDKLDLSSKTELKKDGVKIVEYEKFNETLTKIQNKVVYVDPARTNYQVVQVVSEKNKLITNLSIPAILKSCKNDAEITGMRKAHITDGIALLDFQLWLEKAMLEAKVTEYDVAEKLIEFRSKREGYIGTSFFPISGYQDHGAIVHFHVSPDSANALKPEGILLFDSGGQYEFGTTDITRTIALGPVSDQVKLDFTLVLKGMINLSRINFPKGTHGCHLDVLARAALWNVHQNYGHGTGHGVGAFLNVHEGPGSIRPDLNDQPLRLGNIFSNEPGMYREGEYGIRIENLVLCIEKANNEFGQFLGFETLTMYPIDTALINKSLLLPEEVKWLNDYHQTVFDTLSPHTNDEQLNLLRKLTKAI